MNYLDLFSGIGGFHLGLEQAGFKFDWVGFSEIDKYATQIYKEHFNEAEELGSIIDIRPETLPEIHLCTFGFPCTDLSLAGQRKGLHAERSGLFFEAMRIIEHTKPKRFIFENVPGLYSSNNGRDFETVLRTIASLGIYECEWQSINTRWFLPQNRLRVFFVGHLTGSSRPKVFPFRESDKEFIKKREPTETEIASTLQSPGHACGNYKGMNMVNTVNPTIMNPKLRDYKQKDHCQSLTATDYKDGTNFIHKANPTIIDPLHSTNGGLRFYDKVAPTLNQKDYKEPRLVAWSKSHRTGSSESDKNRHNYGETEYRIKDDEFNTLNTGSGCGSMSTQNFVSSGTLRTHKDGEGFRELKDDVCPTIPARAREDGSGQPCVKIKKVGQINDSQSGAVYDTDGIATTITGCGGGQGAKTGLYKTDANIRRLTPTECERLQGFPDGWTSGLSDTQRYKTLGNAVSVPVVKAIGERILQ